MKRSMFATVSMLAWTVWILDPGSSVWCSNTTTTTTTTIIPLSINSSELPAKILNTSDVVTIVEPEVDGTSNHSLSTTTTATTTTLAAVEDLTNKTETLISKDQPTTSTTTTTVKDPEGSSIKAEQNKKWFNTSNVIQGEQNQLPYLLNCSLTSMTIQVNLSIYSQENDEPYVYLEKLRSFSICRPKIVKSIATFHLSLDDGFYRCGTTKVHDQITGTRIYYNRVMVESKSNRQKSRSIYFKCSQPNIERFLGIRVPVDNDDDHDDHPHHNAHPSMRTKRQSWIEDSSERLVNFTEIDLPENFAEAEVLDFTDNITARAPYPHLNLKVKRNGRFVNTSLNVAPGTPLEMIIYLDDESKHVYGLLASFMKVTDNSNRQQEVIVLNGCSIDPYIFGNFESNDNGDSISAKFRAFKFPESNYVMFVGTVNVCLDQCQPVPCGNGIYALGRRRRRRSLAPVDLARKDPNKVFEIEMMAYLRIGYTPEEMAKRYGSIKATYTNDDDDVSLVQRISTSTRPEVAKFAEGLTETSLFGAKVAQPESLISMAFTPQWISFKNYYSNVPLLLIMLWPYLTSWLLV